MENQQSAISVSLVGCEATLAADLANLAIEAAAAGKTLTPADIAELFDRRQDVGRAYGQVQDGQDPGAGGPSQRGLLESEVRIRGTDIALHSPTIAAKLRHEQLDAWVSQGLIDQKTYDLLWVYVFAHAADKSALRRLFSLPDAKTAAAEFENDLTCYPEDIAAAVLQLMSGYPPVPAGTPQKKTAASTMQRSCAASAASLAATRMNGSMASAKHTPAGWSAPSTRTTGASTVPNSAPAASSIPTAPESKPPLSTPAPSTESAPVFPFESDARGVGGIT